MKLQILGVDDLTKVEVEADSKESFNKVANRAGDLLHYHGNFTLKESRSGPEYPASMNLEDSDEFLTRDPDAPLHISQLVG